MEQEHIYPIGSVRDLLHTDAVTSPTRKALEERIQKDKGEPRFFDAYAFNLLSVICDRLMDQDSDHRIVNSAFFIDERLINNRCDGWRYNIMPPDDVMYVKGLKGIDETATILFQTTFLNLDKEHQLALLLVIQQGAPPGAVWKELSARTFFEEVLAETAEIFFSHPVVQEEYGYAGMADAHGWQKIGLNQRDGIEPTKLTITVSKSE